MNNKLKEDLRNLRTEFNKNRANCLAAIDYFEKYIKTVPKGWTVTFCPDSSARLLIINYNHLDGEKEENPLAVFDGICKKIEGLSLTLTRDIYEYDGSVIALQAKTKPFKHNERDFYIHIRQCQTDKCDFEVVEETVKVAKPSGFCAEVLA